jgi:dTMP kinase
MTPGLFISFEGIDGAGKSSHVQALADAFRAHSRAVTVTREPGGTALAEQLRALVLTVPMDALTEALLMFAARREHLLQVIEPALARGDVVLCDRFTDATFAYQGFGRGQSLTLLQSLEAAVQEGLQPQLTLWFDLDPQVAAQRRAEARAADRFEAEDLAFFERVRQGYLARMQAAPDRFVRIDAALGRSDVALRVAQALRERLDG